MAQKYAWTFVRDGDYLFRDESIFFENVATPRKTVSLEEQKMSKDKNILAYFCAKCKLLCLSSLKYFSQYAQF